MIEVRNLIGGRLVGGAMAEIENPATLKVAGLAPIATAADVDAAVMAARRALGGPWRDEALRMTCLKKAAEIIERESERLAALLSSEQGKPLAAARMEMAIARRILLHYARWQAEPNVLRESESEHVSMERRPLGVAGLIVPWNFPIAILFMKLGPALRAGNSLVVKPAPTTPLATLELLRAVSDCMPEAVINTVTGGVEIGQAVTTHPGITKISFTGSTATGRAVMAAAAPGLKRLTLELGGNDAAIVLDDADLSRTASRLYASAFSNAGQVCAAVKRVYVQRRLYQPMIDALEATARTITVGPGFEASSQMGPVHSRTQCDFVRSLLQEAAGAGARVFNDGPALPDLPGHFLRPAIVSGLTQQALLVQREQFGPALPILPFDHEEDAIAMAEDSEFGLGASVWSADQDRALALGRRLNTGSLYINAHAVPPDPEIPFGGAKQSGIGMELGDWGVDEFSQQCVVRIEKLTGETR
ncbi:aldehyde dehydrogenase family protein [Rhizobium pusense]|uniref:aldehyde dehydrogenase family protein n=1 Tax=Agrobacterium pusense TaxID=648995 RepID=UPI001FCE01FD|nr:aldehyde dehydrogenase family protein [Agrobacterium pusense]MCJ2877402.1 aldehyde dehydrogenase family protein [Agrobacterium pusense]